MGKEQPIVDKAASIQKEILEEYKAELLLIYNTGGYENPEYYKKENGSDQDAENNGEAKDIIRSVLQILNEDSKTNHSEGAEKKDLFESRQAVELNGGSFFVPLKITNVFIGGIILSYKRWEEVINKGEAHMISSSWSTEIWSILEEIEKELELKRIAEKNGVETLQDEKQIFKDFLNWLIERYKKISLDQSQKNTTDGGKDADKGETIFQVKYRNYRSLLLKKLARETCKVLRAQRNHIFLLEDITDQKRTGELDLHINSLIKENKDLRKKYKSKEFKYLDVKNKIKKYREFANNAKNIEETLRLEIPYTTGENEQVNGDDLSMRPLFKYLFNEEGMGKGTHSFLKATNKKDGRQLTNGDYLRPLYDIQSNDNFANVNLVRHEGLHSQLMVALINRYQDRNEVVGVMKVFSKWQEPLFAFHEDELIKLTKYAMIAYSKLESLYKVKQLSSELKKNYPIAGKDFVDYSNISKEKLDEIRKENEETSAEETTRLENGEENKKVVLGKIQDALDKIMEFEVHLARFQDLKLDYSKPEEEMDYQPVINIDLYKEEYAFQRNCLSSFKLGEMKIADVRFFGNTKWKFHPSMNILVGKNGYGKSYLMRLIVAMLQQDESAIQHYFEVEEDGARYPKVKLNLTRLLLKDQVGFDIERGVSKFSYTADEEKENNSITPDLILGKIPVLAIPDVRYVRRSNVLPGVGMPLNGEIKRIGAKAFLEREPYHDMVGEFLSELCINFINEDKEKRKNSINYFKEEQPYALLRKVVVELTGDEEFTFVYIEKVKDGSGFEFLVYMDEAHGIPKDLVSKEDSSEYNEYLRKHAVSIQNLSQGTISVLAIFGMIFRYLKSLHPNVKLDHVQEQSGVVIIDEIDAHLHPSWTESVLDLLEKHFPNVQFFVSTHDPKAVSGKNGSSIVQLNKSESKELGYEIRVFEGEQFVFTSMEEILKTVFGTRGKSAMYHRLKGQIANYESLRKEMYSLEERIADLSVKEQATLDYLKSLISDLDKYRNFLNVEQNKINRITNLEDLIDKLEKENKQLRKQIK